MFTPDELNTLYKALEDCAKNADLGAQLNERVEELLPRLEVMRKRKPTVLTPPAIVEAALVGYYGMPQKEMVELAVSKTFGLGVLSPQEHIIEAANMLLSMYYPSQPKLPLGFATN